MHHMNFINAFDISDLQWLESVAFILSDYISHSLSFAIPMLSCALDNLDEL